MKKIVSILAAVILLNVSCKKKDNGTPEDSTNTTTGSSTTTGFTPPTTNYYIVSDSTHTPDMSIPSCSSNGGSFGISKPFNKLSINPAQLRIFFDSLGSSSYRNIRNSVSEGSYRVFDIDTVPTTITNHVNVELDATEPGGQFFYKAIGKLYVSKTNNKLRFTSNGVLNMKGKKYLGPGFSGSIYSRTVKFSIEEGAQF